MAAIIKREISAYFLSAIGYIVLAAFYIFGGFYFYMSVLMSNTTDLSYTFSSLFVIMIFVIPILTMRLFSEEKKQKTDQVLLTAPVSSIVLGKYFAALIMYLFCILITLVYAVIISFFNTPDWITVLGNFLGIFLLGAALIAIGMFLSSITENQIVAAIGGIVVGVLMLFMDSIAQAISVDFISNILKKISFMSYYNNFTLGVLNLKDIVFFLSVCVLFIFFTIRVFEKKRWS